MRAKFFRLNASMDCGASEFQLLCYSLDSENHTFMTQSHNTLISIIKNNQEMMVKQVHQFCSINSGTSNLPGLAEMAKVLKTSFEPIADEIQLKHFQPISTINLSGETSLQPCGDALFIRKRPHLKRRVLLSGHMDTVYAANHPFQQLKYLDHNRLNGPGVADMKGGIIVMLHALSALEQAGCGSELGWDILINADEETGSKASSAFLDELAPHYQAALVYEPAMNERGTLAKNRKGSGKLTLVATGKSAHAGRDFAAGRNAICYLAEAVCAINRLNGQRTGVTINVGLISGGEALNVVPDKAVAQLDIRISLPEDENWVRNELDTIINHLKHQDYSLTIHGVFGRPVKRICSATEQLFERLKRLGQELGISLDWKDSGGCCDGNNLAKHGVPVLDTLGVRGGSIHSTKEYILLDSLSERAALSSLLMLDLAQGGLEDLKK